MLETLLAVLIWVSLWFGFQELIWRLRVRHLTRRKERELREDTSSRSAAA